jgi:nicotinate-nucleotide--dimethylbenzimidazole phosphoribosyltransferase
MNMLARTAARIEEPNRSIALQTQRLLDAKTKPRGSLGRLEELACQIASIRGSVTPRTTHKAIVVMAADHGVAAEGVSAFPQVVTAQMLLNFVRGGAAINVLARQAGARLVVVDMGTCAPLELNVSGAQSELRSSGAQSELRSSGAQSELREHRIAPGTRNFTREPAMTRQQALAAIEIGIALSEELARSGVTLIGLGDMGIANTTASSALAALFTGAPPDAVIGRGTGVDAAGMQRKLDAVQRGLALHNPNPIDGVGGLAAVGGFEIAGLCGVVLGAAAHRVPVVLDGFICSTAALAAVRIAPAAARYLIASHRSAEAGHRFVLQALDARPLFDLDLRLGEGTGAALAMGLVDSALAILHEMATFESAGVSDRDG